MNNTITFQEMYPLSSVQKEIWFEQLLLPDTPVYNIGGYYKIKGSINIDVYIKSLTILVNEADTLRLKLNNQDGVPLQSFPTLKKIPFKHIDLSNQKVPLKEAQVIIEKDIRKPFQIFKEPLFRNKLIKLSNNSYILSHCCHHLISDGWGISLFMQRVSGIYNALLKNIDIPVYNGIPYHSYIKSDDKYLNSDEFKKGRKYWSGKFSTLPDKLLHRRSDYKNKYGNVVGGSVHTWILSRSTYSKLNEIAQSNSVTMFHVFLSFLYTYFSRVYEKDDCVIGIPILNRSNKGFKQTIGLFSSMIPLRLSFEQDIDFISVIKKIGRSIRECYRHQRFPLSEINKVAGIFKDGRSRLFDICLSFEIHNYNVSFGNSLFCEPNALIHNFERNRSQPIGKLC